ncbi:MAG: arylamine N-acetyltransferase [Xanthomonadaceae bacterium]|nr:arylamine N-acetyltransferase [Xanthomonadaceae bacterium]
MNAFDLDAYFKRIRYAGPRSPTLDTLRAIHALHPAAIPFENLNPLLRLPVLLDTPSLQSKLIEEKRGGYCFEQNLLFKQALESLRFPVTGLAARVIWNRSEDAITSRSHMLLLVEVEGEQYIADVGFGGQTLTAPLRLELDVEQETPHEPFRLIEHDGDFLLQAKIRDQWKSLYRFDLQRQYPVDYEVSSWYLSNHPESPFVTGLRVARAMPGKRFNLFGKELTTHTRGAESTSHTLRSVDELRDTLETIFGIQLPEHPDLARKLDDLMNV